MAENHFFCPYCGAKMTVIDPVCPNCGRTNDYYNQELAERPAKERAREDRIFEEKEAELEAREALERDPEYKELSLKAEELSSTGSPVSFYVIVFFVYVTTIPFIFGVANGLTTDEKARIIMIVLLVLGLLVGTFFLVLAILRTRRLQKARLLKMQLRKLEEDKIREYKDARGIH